MRPFRSSFVFSAATIVAACSSSTTDLPPASIDAGAPVDAATTTRDAAGPAGPLDFCTVVRALSQRCGYGGTCGAAEARDCERWAQNFSLPTVLAASACAITACQTTSAATLLLAYVQCVSSAARTFDPTLRELEQAWCPACDPPHGVGCMSDARDVFEKPPPQLGDPSELQIYDDAIVRACEACIPPPEDGGIPAACGKPLGACVHATATAAMWEPPECGGGADAGAD